MKMADEDTGYTSWGDISKNELSLRSLPWIKKKSFPVPSNQVSSMISPSGRLLTRASQND